MKVLLSCAGGMSSSILADAIKDEAKKEGVEIIIDPIGTESVEERLESTNYDLILLAPQVLYRKDFIEGLAKGKNIPVMPIKGTEYNPLAAPKLFKEIKEYSKE